ncbi:bacteriocin biosynthesis cyclodehydratase [Staphylococcus aureus]|uniref:bacteriocin biosynthesis cyclodehydratase n=1 Tax=Staphylococcus aureus TaxID=1280 RepID=UPI000CD0EB5F|nr:bacteriocin biosynthesis cyclodehydratase [Staphylococcus aureus]MCM0449714.1 bacteriocin biosynthesis cyclodehydratase [Staphylococcus aureus]MCM0454904.1 bacteriocin biosynthesis cyclodehydratase [Staphylococcus aureus]MCM0460038.1 bacteriocin biosynthesis cyclodehydratase [Staphylococcus aureus]MCM0462793.1 bacteriocin biosynthesis cyclodehydratase [Staphylococcus aureus]MCM0467882.1 bacteriocin biosynthesis cyclodehydratase [Staphylococcus aureus]
MKTFIKPKDLFVEENNSEYILKKGYLHQHSIAIDKEESSKNFIVKFKTLIAENQIELNENDDVIDDFNKLTQLNLIHKKIDTFNKICIITDKTAKAFFKDHLDQVDEIYEFNEVLERHEIETLNNQKSNLSINEVVKKQQSKLANMNVFVILSYANQPFIKAFNFLTNLLDITYTLAFYDNENVFFTNIQHGETGCYECLERQLVSKFPGKIENYLVPDEQNQGIYNLKLYSYILSIMINEINNIEIYGDSTLIGNVLHFYLPTYEYNFNFNKRQSTCSTCSTINNVLFKEQNIKSANILKRVLENDNL